MRCLLAEWQCDEVKNNTTAAARATMQRVMDLAAFGVSALCLVHCLALPLIAAVMPLAAIMIEEEWIHRLFLIFAAIAAFFAIGPGLLRNSLPRVVPVFAACGLAGLAGAIIVESPVLETGLTVVGAIALAIAHILNWRAASRCHRREAGMIR